MIPRGGTGGGRRAAKKKVAKKEAAKKKVAAKKAPAKAATGQREELKKDTLQQLFFNLAKRKTGVTMEFACDKLKTTPGSIRVTAKVLRDKGYKVTHDGKVYKAS